ncbi:ATP-binding protein [Streptomyces sp. 8K308]|uniref:ATP-binding protein n=1 Tax=Streptomyces sp. 8K308 TaxID=2530388 RepID=UPI001FB5AFB7|nr:ATP-binding protein [Streptomyces sp. 8K308]
MLDQLGQPFPPVDLRTLSGTATLGLTQRPESVRRARDFTRNTLQGWRLPQHFDSVGLVVSELVTNALRHGLGPRPSPTVPPQANGRPATPAAPVAPVAIARPLVELELMRCAHRLICAVQDPSGALPRSSDEMDGAAESGRGLHLVECFSDGWGWRMLAGGRGKVVWAAFQTD